MTQDRILKIMKGLNTFSQDDIIIMADIYENEASKIIAELVKEEKIISVGDKYKYLNKISDRKTTLQLVEKPEIKVNQNNNINFKQAAEYFLVNYASINCTPSTFKTYASIIKVHLTPFFGKMNLKDITQKEIKEFIDLKQKQYVSNKRINNSVTLFGNIFNKFKEWGFISESPYNGIINVKFPKENNVRILEETEVNSLLEKSKTDYPNLYPLILLILFAGLKRAEILALQKKDINLINKKISINKTFFEGKIIIAKFKSIIRQVDIPENIIRQIKQVIKYKKEDDFIFYEPILGSFTIDRQMRKQLSGILRALNIDKLTFNDLRHTYEYNRLQERMSVDYLHKQLGDYSIQATMDKYRDFIKN